MQTLKLSVQEASEDLFQMLEDKGYIHRICPGRDEHLPAPGAIECSEIYRSDPVLGSHRLISVTINRYEFSAFGVHSDNEEFLLLGELQAKPLLLLIALCGEDELREKTNSGALSETDFVLIRCKFNDPYLSFFTMKKGVPHGEATYPGEEKAPTFYVTESCGLDLKTISFDQYRLKF